MGLSGHEEEDGTRRETARGGGRRTDHATRAGSRGCPGNEEEFGGRTRRGRLGGQADVATRRMRGGTPRARVRCAGASRSTRVSSEGAGARWAGTILLWTSSHGIAGEGRRHAPRTCHSRERVRVGRGSGHELSEGVGATRQRERPRIGRAQRSCGPVDTEARRGKEARPTRV